ncbi:S9 family peptidase [Crocinitomicaceae bacterium]|nr:S9 family peptidase [Crocinitomicaceae bacterium]
MKMKFSLISTFIILTTLIFAQSKIGPMTSAPNQYNETSSKIRLMAQKEHITVEDIWKDYKFIGAGVNGFRSMKDGTYFSKITRINGEKAVTKHSFVDYSGSGEVLIAPTIISNIDMDGYSFNSDETKALITTETKSIYRRSYSAVFYCLDLQTKKLRALDPERQPQTLAEYSPDGNKVSYIFKNNLYVKDLLTGKIKQLTKDGATNKVINGTTDWVYEEEFAITKAYDWSPDSKYIAFLRFDESNVRDFTMTAFHELYPNYHTFKYPKAGEENSKVTALIIKAKGGKAKQIDLSDYEYIPRMQWAEKENNLIIQTMNRHQNKLRYHLIALNKNKISVNLMYEEQSNTYVEIDDNLLLLRNREAILRTSEQSGFNHIYLLDFNGNTTQITKGKWDVIEFLGVNEKSNTIYFTAAKKGPLHKGIYSIKMDGSTLKAISKETGTNGADFSNGMSYFIKRYSNANTPTVYSLCDNTGKEIEILETNNRLNTTLRSYKMSTKLFVTFQGHEHELNGFMIKPPNFDKTKKYPVYMEIYGGPGANEVSDSWGGMGYIYHQLLAQRGYIVVSVDPRGTMYRGADFKKSTYRELGKLETEDFIAVAKELQGYDFVDSNRIGIMGWSYGGFMTSLAMTKGADLFKMGIAVAPVTNWRFYDNIYTERFMRTPEENPNGYDQNSPINYVEKLKGNYLLIHGSGDDNVHYQNTMEMISALVAANKQFDVFIYPNKNHGIYGGNTRNHLYSMMLNYTLKNL